MQGVPATVRYLPRKRLSERLPPLSERRHCPSTGCTTPATLMLVSCEPSTAGSLPVVASS
eukprot:25252-Eustigmatos_ZCMA.PRE.1